MLIVLKGEKSFEHLMVLSMEYLSENLLVTMMEACFVLVSDRVLERQLVQ